VAAEQQTMPKKESRRRLRWWSGAARVVLGLLFVVGVYFSLVPSGRASVRAGLILPALLGARDVGPLAAVGEPIRHTQMTLFNEAGAIYLDIYAPTTAPPPIPGSREGVLLIPGVGDNRTDAQLVNLSEAMAREGLVAVDMTTTTLIDYVLSPLDGDSVVRAVQAVQRLPGVGKERVGIVGFSAAGALACLAAIDPRIRGSLAFITLFGSYFDATTLLRDFGRRAIEVNGKLQAWNPNIVPLQVLANTFAGTLPAGEGAILMNAFANGVTPLSPSDLAQLSPPAVAAYHLLAGDEPAQADANIAALSPQMHALFGALSPSAIVGQIKTPLYLLHDRNDQFVPFTQSRDFAAALTRLGSPHEYAEFGIFQHVEVKSGQGGGQLLHDGLSLFQVLSLLLEPAS
jgi:acetyl esterase/lipase